MRQLFLQKKGKIKKWNPKTPGPDASLTGKLTLSGSGNLGISDVVSAGLGVKGVFTMSNEFAVGQETYSNRNVGKRDPAAKKKRLKNQAMLSKKENILRLVKLQRISSRSERLNYKYSHTTKNRPVRYCFRTGLDYYITQLPPFPAWFPGSCINFP